MWAGNEQIIAAKAMTRRSRTGCRAATPPY